ncbi:MULTISPECIES: hypothetical protein [unclassified Actinobaculum]|uniref:hypothetical protein n=1 Tax=unclassified Actinobaculum TaxID=2609299 RepID=UPI000D52A3F4|nr:MULTISPECIES: hypothetical protein [unclassified Actinobaculum]AWE41737.1 hypothetical protein DDD63_02000 [Actinobaculum sp. 313]RTE50350.1 hypothetical protein EKN07_03905 [Actinobaculum sp. 352]
MLAEKPVSTQITSDSATETAQHAATPSKKKRTLLISAVALFAIGIFLACSSAVANAYTSYVRPPLKPGGAPQYVPRHLHYPELIQMAVTTGVLGIGATVAGGFHIRRPSRSAAILWGLLALAALVCCVFMVNRINEVSGYVF